MGLQVSRSSGCPQARGRVRAPGRVRRPANSNGPISSGLRDLLACRRPAAVRFCRCLRVRALTRFDPCCDRCGERTQGKDPGSNVLSQRIGLASRQCADRQRIRQLRVDRRGACRISGAVRSESFRRPPSNTGARLRFPTPPVRGTNPLPGRLRAPSRGPGPRCSCFWRAPSGDGAAPQRQIVFERALLPDFLPWVRIANLQVGAATVDLLLERRDFDVGIQVRRRSGDVQVIAIK
jgi:hypothetical protein